MRKLARKQCLPGGAERTMFAIGLSEEERLIQQTARRFASERLGPRLREHERSRAIFPALLQEFSTLGLASVDRPVADGGQGLGAFCKVLVLEELAVADAGAALALDPSGLAVYPLMEAGALALVRDGRRCVVVDDTAERFRVAGERVSGDFPWIAADEVDAVLILGSRRALLVDDGIQTTPVRPCGLEVAGASELRLRDAAIALRIEDAGAVARARARIRVHVAALLVGVARAACAYATRYATERTAFGKPIAHHQALAFLLVDMAIAVDAARMAVWRAGVTIDRGDDPVWAGAAALAEAAEQALFVTPSAVQVLGGHGFMKDHPVEKYMRDARTLAQLGGGRDACELDAAAVVVDHDLGIG